MTFENDNIEYDETYEGILRFSRKNHGELRNLPKEIIGCDPILDDTCEGQANGATAWYISEKNQLTQKYRFQLRRDIEVENGNGLKKILIAYSPSIELEKGYPDDEENIHQITELIDRLDNIIYAYCRKHEMKTHGYIDLRPFEYLKHITPRR